MPWYFPWSDGLKKRACRYLLQRYLGQFLQEKLSLDQLNVDLYSGKGKINDVFLDVQALNELGEKYGFPIEIVDGFIGSISVSIPWSSLLCESSVVEVQGLALTLQPKQRNQNGSLMSSLWGSMMSSLQIAEECLRERSTESDKEADAGQPFDGLEHFAQTIDTVFRRIKVSFTDTVVRLEHIPKTEGAGMALEMRINLLEYFDEAGVEETLSESNVYQPAAFANKKFRLVGVSIFSDEFSASNQSLWRSSSSGLKTPDRSGNLSPGYATGSTTTSQMNFSTESKPTSDDGEGVCDPVLIAKLPDQQEIKLKLKQDDTLSGPQLEIEVNFGLVPVFLTPRQVHLFLEIIRNLKQPNCKQTYRKQSVNKPMDLTDFNLVEQELQKHLSRPSHLSGGRSLNKQHHGWSSHSLDDSEDEFHPVQSHNHMTMAGSSKSSESNLMESSIESSRDSIHSGLLSSNTKPVRKNIVQGLLDESFSDETKFKVTCSSLCAFLLQEDVGTTPIKCSEPLSLTAVAEKFFVDFFQLLKSQHSLKDMMTSRAKLTSICGMNHICLTAVPAIFEGQKKSSLSQSILSTTLTVGNMELFECLLDKMNTSSNGQKLNETYTEILKFSGALPYSKDANLPFWNEPSLKVKYVQKDNSTQSFQEPYSKLSFQLGPLLSEIDITIVDRLHSLFNPQPFPSKWEKNSINSTGKFLEVDSRNLSSEKLDIHVSSPFLVLNIRFPIPDLRPVHSLERVPWWKKNLRDETLIIEMTEATLNCSWNPNATESKFEVQSKDVHGLFQSSKSEAPLSFFRIAVDPRADKNSSESGFDWPRLVVKISPTEIPSILDEVDMDINDQLDSVHPSSSMYTYMHHMNAPTVSPFASRKVVYDRASPPEGSKQYSGGGIGGEDADQVVMPADREQMMNFVEKTMSHCKLTLEILLPTLNVFLPSKEFYEILYNRISTDLVFWEPAAPQPVYSSESLYQENYHLKSHLIKESAYFEAFSVCKSGAQCDSSSDSEDGGTNGFYSIYDSSHKRRSKQHRGGISPQIRAQSNIVIQLNVSQGILNFCTKPVSASESALDDESVGEFQINIEEGMFFFVSGHKGQPEVSYTCLTLNQATLYHCGCVNPPIRGTMQPAILVSPSHLQQTVFSSEPGVLPVLNSTALTGEHCDLFSLVIRTGLDTLQQMKTFKVALGLQEATLRHRMSSMSESWLSQLIGFFDVSNEHVDGYVPPAVVTELHYHMHSCAIDYRPLFLPYRAMATVEKFSISSNLAAHSTTSLLRIISEELSLYISNRTDTDTTDLKKNYVCVVDTGLFDVSLRMSDGKDSPINDLRATNNTVHIHTCADSCSALQELLTYFSANGDLQNSGETFFDAQEEPQSLIYNDGRDPEPATLVNRLMEDAMLENSNSSGSSIEVEMPKTEEENCEIAHEALDSNDSDEFCILEDDLGTGIIPASGEPQVRQLIHESFRLIENHFAKPIGRSDQLKAPSHYPKATKRYTLREMSLVWHMYGGHDFQPPSIEKQPEKVKKKARIAVEETEIWNPDDFGPSSLSPKYEVSLNLDNRIGSCGGGIQFRKSLPHESIWANINMERPIEQRRATIQPPVCGGGQGRSRNILVELQMNKLRFQHEVYPVDSEYASRQALLIQDVEIRDRLASSEINKLLYQFSSETLPRQTHANMVQIKAVHIRPDPSVPTSECSLRISLKPLRLNIDQDTLVFLCGFFGRLSSVEEEQCLHQDAPPNAEPMSFSPYNLPGDENMSNSGQTDVSDSSSTSSSRLGPPIFFRSLVFSPDVPIQLDYHGKRVDMDQGALAGLLMGLGQLNKSRIILKRISYRHGLLGVDRLFAHAMNEWLQDIRKNQLPSLLGGLGPMYSFVQLFQGVRDLIWLPIEQYRKDGRIMRGIQRGANSFTTSTTMAFLELTNRMVLIIQGAAEFAYDLVSPGPSVKANSRVRHRKWHLNSQPLDIREGVANAYHVFREGIGDTARTIVRVTSEEHEHKGMPGAVGGVLRQIPPIMVKPIILATEATSNVLGGVRNQLVPDARRDAVEKWRSRKQH